MAWTAFSTTLRLFYRRLGIFLAGNLLWILASLPIITLPAATGGLFYLAHRVVLEEREHHPVAARPADFWVGFRQFGPRSTALALLDAGVIAVMALAIRFYWLSPVEPLRWLVGPTALLLLGWWLIQLYLFPALIVFPEKGLFQIAREAFLWLLRYPMYTALLSTWLVILIVICVALAGPVLLILFSLVALVQTMALRFARVASGDLEPVTGPREE